MMTENEFMLNGANGYYNPELPLGYATANLHNTARPKEMSENDRINRDIIKSVKKFYPTHLKRPFGPLYSPQEARIRDKRDYRGNINPITGLDPWEEYRLTGGRSYIPDSIKLDDTPNP